MIRECNGTDPNLIEVADGHRRPCGCGAIFDDVEFMVVYPHHRVHGRGTWWDR